MLKKFILAFLSLLLCFSSPLYSYASEVKAAPFKQSLKSPAVVEEVNVIFIPEHKIALGAWDELTVPIELESIDWDDAEVTPNAPPEKKVTATFRLPLSMNKKRGSLNVTVQGRFNKNDSSSEVAGVQARITGAVSPYYSTAVSSSGNEGYVDLYSNAGDPVGRYVYRINTAGKNRLIGVQQGFQ